MNAPFPSQIEAAAHAWDVPALAAGFSVGDTTVLGAAGCEAGTVFRIASITKPLTATLAVGLLDPEAATGVWPDDVRVRHLLSHTSGYDGECGDLARFGFGDDALGRAVAELPGTRRFAGVEQVWSYANSGYWLAAHLAAERAGEPYEPTLAARVLRPAGLESTSFGEPELAGTGPAAKDERYPRARRPSGGLVSNVPDLLRFGRWHLSRPEFARLRVAHGKPIGAVYGLGLFGERVGGAEVWGHPGSYGGFQSSLLLVPARDAVFAGLTNSSHGERALRELEDVFFERVLGARRDVPETAELSRALLETFTGTYARDDERLEIALAAGGLVVSLEGSTVATRAIGAGTFEITEGECAQVRFDFPLEGFGRFESQLFERVA